MSFSSVIKKMSNQIHAITALENSNNKSMLNNRLDLKYLCYWMQLIGIIPISKILTFRNWNFQLVYRYGCWLLSVAANVSILVQCCLDNYENRKSVISTTNVIIDYFNFGIHAIFVHSLLLLPDWIKRFNILKESILNNYSLTNFSPDSASLKNVQLLTFFGVLYVIISVILNCINCFELD